MTHRERFFATISNQPVDKPASWLGLPAQTAEAGLLKYFETDSMDNLRKIIDDDIYPIEVPYNFPPLNHIACAFDFAKANHDGMYEERTLTDPGFFEDYEDPAKIDDFNWPDPSMYLDIEEARRRAMSIDPEYIRMGVLWSAHFQDACAAFGMEKAMMTMYINPEMFKAVIDRITDFYLKANELFYEATKGHLDAVLIGNDFGSQNNLMVDPDALRDLVFPGTKRLIEQAKSYGLKVIHHSCGSIFPIIDDLIEMGVDVIHPIQALAKNMDAENLKNNFENKVSFCGGVDAQHLLVNGNPQDVHNKVKELVQIFPTGLIISPSHEAILPDIPPANIKALFNALDL